MECTCSMYIVHVIAISVYTLTHMTNILPSHTVETQMVVEAREIHAALAAAHTSYCGKFTSYISPSEQLLSLHFPIRFFFIVWCKTKNENRTIVLESMQKKECFDSIACCEFVYGMKNGAHESRRMND